MDSATVKVAAFVIAVLLLSSYLSILLIVKPILDFTINKTFVKDVSVHQSIDEVTVRVNTFRRLDLLETFLSHYHRCSVVKQIQVIWSDPENNAPVEWSKRYVDGRVIFEVHQTNSLNHRFHNITPVPTEAVLSIDDDLVVPCDVIERSFRLWRSNKRVLVGFSPRMVVWDIITGTTKYLHWQHTWWTGIYSVVLTKACFLHREYLLDYVATIPVQFLKHIDIVRNCEDLAMSFLVAKRSDAAPVWFQGVVYETGGTAIRISSSHDHFDRRGECISQLTDNTTGSWPFVTGFQKDVPVNVFDVIRHFYDKK